MVWSADERHVARHGAAHGDLGARPGRRSTRSGSTDADTPRLKHIAHLGVRTRAYSYSQHGLTPPATDVRVELTAPDGAVWTWGDAAAPDRVVGPAGDFCLVVVQRRHVDDTDLVCAGAARA